MSESPFNVEIFVNKGACFVSRKTPLDYPSVCQLAGKAATDLPTVIYSYRNVQEKMWPHTKLEPISGMRFLVE